MMLTTPEVGEAMRAGNNEIGESISLSASITAADPAKRTEQYQNGTGTPAKNAAMMERNECFDRAVQNFEALV